MKNCWDNCKCFNCQGNNYHAGICDCLKRSKSNAKETKIVTANDDNKNDENVSMLVDAKTDFLLQTADCIISNPSETKSLKVKILLDPGSQNPYLCDTVRDFLQLDTISKQNVQIKAFGDTKGSERVWVSLNLFWEARMAMECKFICQVLVFLWFVGQ